MKGLYIETWGCQMNEYDSKRMAELLEASHGLKLVESPEKANLLLMNTCSIREKAQEKVFSRLGQWRELKETRPDVVIGVGGCVASQEGKAIRQRAPYVDIVFGPQTLHRLPQLLNNVKRNGLPAIDITFPKIEKFDCLPEPKADGPCAFVSIQEGCNKFCTYCIVPYTRGEEINRPFVDVIREIASLAEQGVREVNLLGQNVNAYLGKMPNGHEADLALLIRFIAEIEGIERIRFTTSHPKEFSPSLIAAFRDVPKLVNHLHLPVQSGSDKILNAMNRGYSALEFKSIIRQLKTHRPNISLSSDFIVGFPGETDDDFQQTLDLVKTIGFDNSYSFIYSPRPGTPAANISDSTPMEIKKERLQVLQDVIFAQSHAISQAMVDTDEWVLVTGTSKNNSEQLSGRTENNRVVHFDGPSEWIGKIIKVHITEALRYSLRATTCADALC